MSVDDSNVIHCYSDLWRTKQERQSLVYQGTDDESTDANMLRLTLSHPGR